METTKPREQNFNNNQEFIKTMKTTYFKTKPIFKDIPSTFYVKVTDGKSIEVSDDNIYINDGTYEELVTEYMSSRSLIYVKATEEEFKTAFLKITQIVDELNPFETELK